jgi:hypothetical protein
MGKPDTIWYFNSFVELRNRVFDRNYTEDMLLARVINGTGAVALHVSPESQKRLTQIIEAEFQHDDRARQYYVSKQVGGDFATWQPKLQASWRSVVVYDAAMAIGIAACSADNDRLTGPDLYKAIKSPHFEGALGEVTFDSVTGTRNPEGLRYLISNLVIEESLICAGALVLALPILPATLQEPVSQEILDAGCMLQPWLFSIGLTIAFAAIFSKVWRIYKVFEHAKGFRRIELKAKDVLLPFLGPFVANAAVLTAWTIDAPLKWARLPVSFDVYGRVFDSYGTCYGPDKGNRSWYFYTSLTVYIGALLVANYQSYRAKVLPPIFNESMPLLLTNFL